MVKKKAVKKKNIKRAGHIRKSIGALCLATAIAVAAIPVPENLADGGAGGGGVVAASDYGYTTAQALDDALAAGTVSVGAEHATSTNASKLNKASHTVKNGSYSYKQTSNGRTMWHIQEIYDFYEETIGSTLGAVVCGHKDMTGKSEISIGEYLYADYIKIPKTIAEAFKSTAFNGSGDKFEEYELEIPTPTSIVSDVYTFELDLNSGSPALVQGANTLTLYDVAECLFKDEFDAYCDSFNVQNPVPFKKKIETDQQYMKLFCFLTTVKPKGETAFRGRLKDCTLWNVVEDAHQSGGGQVAENDDYYIPQIIDHTIGINCVDEDQTKWTHPNWMYNAHDSNGFLCTGKSQPVIGIASNTFSDVGNQVTKINLTGAIAYVGESAFEGAGMVTTLVAPNLKFIGDNAFKDCANLSELQWTKTVTVDGGSMESNPQIEEIGADAFKNSGMVELELPTSLKKVCTGAFSDCSRLKKVYMEAGNRSSVLQLCSYAFYNDNELVSVEWQDNGANIDSLGEACFAAPYGNTQDKLATFTFPNGPGGATSASSFLGDHVLAGRGGALTDVIMPTGDWGTASVVNLPKHTFEGCFNLDRVDFKGGSTGIYTGGNIKYDKSNDYVNGLMFKDTLKDTFVVHGPELRNLGGGNTDRAWPRQSTWYCENGAGRAIPYTFEKNGQTYYEICQKQPDGTRYVLSVIDKGGVGELVSCERLDTSASITGVDLVIPKNVGEIQLTSIATTLFDQDPVLKNNLTSLSFEEGCAIEEIQSGVFDNCPKLKTIKLCSSISKIDANAFGNLGSDASVTKVDVYFTSPSVDMPDNAFSTADDVGMTFHGDAGDLENYRPFQVAMKVPINDSLNICYVTNSPSCQTIMLNRKDSLPTLVDYPHFDDIDDRFYENDLGSPAPAYGTDDFNVLYNGRDSLSYIAKKTLEAVYDWNTKYNNSSSPQYLNVSSSYKASNDGPWNYPSYKYSIEKADAARNTEDTSADAPSLKPWLNLDSTGEAIVDGVKNLVVPKGVKSVDAELFYNTKPVGGKNNDANILMYLSPQRSLYMNPGAAGELDTTVPGLFSGYILEDIDSTTAIKAKHGNDYVETITLNSVEYLPDYCFASCENLYKVDLGVVEDVGTLPFKDCPKMTTVLADADGPYKYSSESGILYEENDKGYLTIIECLQNVQNPTINTDLDSNLSRVSDIEPFAFEDCNKITTVDFTGVDQLSVIPISCFKNCKKLSNVSLPSNVRQILSKAFDGCETLSTLGSAYIRGVEMDIADDGFMFQADAEGRSYPIIYSYEDSGAIKYAQRLGFYWDLLGDKTYLVKFIGQDGNIIDPPGIVEVDAGHTALEEAAKITIPLVDGMEFKHWNPEVADTVIEEDTTFYAVYEPTGETPEEEKLTVLFLDWDGSTLAAPQTVSMGGSATPPADPTRSGYTFTGWNPDYRNVLQTTACIAQYKSNSGSDSDSTDGKYTVTFVNYNGDIISRQQVSKGSDAEKPKDPKRSGYTFKGWEPSYKNITKDTVCVAQFESDDDDDDDDDDDSNSTGHLVTVIDGLGSGRYVSGQVVTVSANPAPEGMTFYLWKPQTFNINVANVSNNVTTFTMPNNDVVIQATYRSKDGSTNPDDDNNRKKNSQDGDGDEEGVNGTEKSNCRVEITKGGIPAIHKATARVIGSGDEFVLKISDTSDSETLVRAALAGKYGQEALDTERILYTAFDMTLYDSTGETPVSDYTGISVEVTLPIPSKTAQYGGNNRPASAQDAILEDLSATYRDLDGTPAVTFTANHFSPYTIYVDLQNLNGELDYSPKTGDPIHPKWFLSIGLACLSAVLFLKKDKKTVG